METRLQRLFQGLRLCGAVMIVTAAGTFLVQSWDRVGDVRRYLCLLAMTGALPVLAYLCGIRLRESRSARAFLITLLALLPIHAGVLGGFVLSQFGEVHRATAGVAQWVAPSPVAATLLVLGAGLVLAPLVWSAFRVLCREHAGALTVTSLFAHGLVLIPDRSALGATFVVVPILGAATWRGLHVKPKTTEAKIAVASLITPALLVVARQVLFYDVSWVFWGTVLGACAVALVALGEHTGDKTLTRFSVVPTLLSVGALWAELRFSLSAAEWFLTYGLLTAIPMLAFAWKTPSSRSFFVATAATVNSILVGLVVLFDPSPWASFEAIALGLGLASYGFLRGRRFPLYSGIALVGPGFITEVAHAIEVFRPSGWLALVTFGLMLVALTAWLEHRARQLTPPNSG